jgi:hypothetical protein
MDGIRYGNMFFALRENPTHEIERVKINGRANGLDLRPEAVRVIVGFPKTTRTMTNDGREANKRSSKKNDALQMRSSSLNMNNIYYKIWLSNTYGHSQLKTGHPVRSAIHKQLNGRLVLRWVTTWESLLLYVLHRSLLFALLIKWSACSQRARHECSDSKSSR